MKDETGRPAGDGGADTAPGRFYRELAAWWPLLSSPEDYEEEAGIYTRLLRETARREVRDVLELGCGGGNNALHMKTRFEMCLTDISPEMLAVSRAQNPECTHAVADMRGARLGRRFDAVFVHDAASYLLDEGEVAAMLATARAHLRSGGAALFAPDLVAERFRSTTSCGGHDDGERSLRYLEWIWDPDPTDGTYLADYVFMLREAGELRVERDRHVCGLLPRDRWLDLIAQAGMRPELVVFEHSEMDDAGSEIFVAVAR